MLVAEARYLGTLLAIVVALLVPMIGSVAIARLAHLADWAAMALFLVMICGIAYVALALWLRGLRARSVTARTGPSETQARFAPTVISLALFIVQAYWIATAWSTFETSHWKQGADSFALACIFSAYNTYFALREWRSKAAIQGATTQPSPFDRTRLGQFTAALAEPTKAARAAALRPLRVRGRIRLGLIALEVSLMLLLVPKVGISLALVGSFTIVAGIFLIGHEYFDL